MKVVKRLLLALGVLLLFSQFIRPEKHLGGEDRYDISRSFRVPREISVILRTSCYDCHSNETLYPWYFEIQPLGWWINGHIRDGKQELNFSEFAGYRLRRQYRKLEEVAGQVSEGKMPLPSYLLIHSGAKLSQAQRERLSAWATELRDSMRAMYPPDSLERTP